VMRPQRDEKRARCERMVGPAAVEGAGRCRRKVGCWLGGAQAASRAEGGRGRAGPNACATDGGWTACCMSRRCNLGMAAAAAAAAGADAEREASARRRVKPTTRGIILARPCACLFFGGKESVSALKTYFQLEVTKGTSGCDFGLVGSNDAVSLLD
jgi:hypothetical protein